MRESAKMMSHVDPTAELSAAVNKDAEHAHDLHIPLEAPSEVTLLTLSGDSKDAYNDVGHEGVRVTETSLGPQQGRITITLPPHSVNVICIG